MCILNKLCANNLCEECAKTRESLIRISETQANVLFDTYTVYCCDDDNYNIYLTPFLADIFYYSKQRKLYDELPKSKIYFVSKFELGYL